MRLHRRFDVWKPFRSGVSGTPDPREAMDGDGMPEVGRRRLSFSGGRPGCGSEVQSGARMVVGKRCPGSGPAEEIPNTSAAAFQKNETFGPRGHARMMPRRLMSGPTGDLHLPMCGSRWRHHFLTEGPTCQGFPATASVSITREGSRAPPPWNSSISSRSTVATRPPLMPASGLSSTTGRM